jgi:hypothetical protein
VSSRQKRFLIGVMILLFLGLLNFSDRVAAFLGPHARDPCGGPGHHYAPIVIGDAYYLSCEADPLPQSN